MNSKDHAQLRRIQGAGWDATKTDEVRFNSGSETLKHFVLKSVVAKLLVDRGFKVSSEVVHDTRGEIDIVCHGEPGYAPWCVEVETHATDDVIQDKIKRYVKGTTFRECFVLAVEDAPTDIGEMYQWVENKLF